MGLPLRILQEEVASDALSGDEQPAILQAGMTGDCAHAATERNKRCSGVREAAAKFDPRVARSVGIAAHEKIPLDAFSRIAVRLDAARRNFAVEKERKL